MNEDTKRLFFGVEAHAPWPEKLPVGRLLDEEHRHFTLAFLGNIEYKTLREHLKDFPAIPMKTGSVGIFDSCLMLPMRHPNVVAWHAHWLDSHSALESFQKILSNWLSEAHYSMENREWLPHLTVCRKPFDPHAWKKSFVSLPFYTGSIHLYESKGNLTYTPLWSHYIRPPFEEIEHTADIAFNIYAENIQQLYHHAFMALAFKHLDFLRFFIQEPSLNTLDDIIIVLNEIVGRADCEGGCPMKAVSFHGDINFLEDSTLQWEMIIDV